MWWSESDDLALPLLHTFHVMHDISSYISLEIWSVSHPDRLLQMALLILIFRLLTLFMTSSAEAIRCTPSAEWRQSRVVWLNSCDVTIDGSIVRGIVLTQSDEQEFLKLYGRVDQNGDSRYQETSIDSALERNAHFEARESCAFPWFHSPIDLHPVVRCIHDTQILKYSNTQILKYSNTQILKYNVDEVEEQSKKDRLRED